MAANTEHLKEEIGWLKVVFAVVTALDASLIVWISQHYASANPIIVTLSVLIAVGLTMLLIGAIWRVYLCLDQLEKR